MSYQLVFTSAARLLDVTAAPGYGVVARTAGMSKALSDKLITISGFKERGVSGIVGPQYSYRRIEHRGNACHVLTVAQSAGSDYSGRSCYIAHHLVLTADEVAAMRHNSKRPTPAGIIHALEQSGFWMKTWEGEPRELSGDPKLSAALLPDATVQATWKALTGHKSNARAFFTPPYEGECLCLVPEGILSEQLLLLINESDWLSSSRGWGRTFTTHGNETDSFSTTQRIFANEGSSLQERAYRSQRPILRILPDLILPVPDPTAEGPGRRPAQDSDSPLSSINVPPSTTSMAGWPYRYCESDDSETYDFPPKRLNWLRLCGLLLGIAVLASGLSILVEHHYARTAAAAASASASPSQRGNGSRSSHRRPKSSLPENALDSGTVVGAKLTQQDIVARLRDLSREPYSHNNTQLVLDKLEKGALELEATDNAELQQLINCLRALNRASAITTGFADDLSIMMDFIESYNRQAEEAERLDAQSLCSLYMNEATYGRIPDHRWHRALLDDLRSWRALLDKYPLLRIWLRSNSAYMGILLSRCASADDEGLQTSPSVPRFRPEPAVDGRPADSGRRNTYPSPRPNKLRPLPLPSAERPEGADNAAPAQPSSQPAPQPGVQPSSQPARQLEPQPANQLGANGSAPRQQAARPATYVGTPQPVSTAPDTAPAVGAPVDPTLGRPAQSPSPRAEERPAHEA